MIGIRKPKHRAPRRPIPAHPILLAAVPVLALWVHNLTEGVGFRDVILPLTIVLGGALAVTLVATLLFRGDYLRGGLIAAVVVFLVFSFGPLSSGLEKLKLGDVAIAPAGVVAGLCLVTLAAATVAIVRAGPARVAGLTRGLNFVAVGLIVFNAIAISTNRIEAFVPEGLPSALAGAAKADAAPLGKPDIYHIILDTYGGEKALRELLGFDNRPFLDELERRGFYLPEHPRTNYARTLLYLSATMNLDYVHNLVPKGTKIYGGTLDPLIQNDAVPKFLKAKGYTYIHVGSWPELSATNPQADQNVVLGQGLSEFSNALLQQTAVAPALEAVGSPEFDKQQYDRALFQFDQLAKTKDLEGPKYVFGHIIVPHWPYIFDENGRFAPSGVTMDDIKRPLSEVSTTVREAYLAQLKFVSKKTLTLLDTLLSGPLESRPIVVLHSDEGFFTWLYGGPRASDRDLLQHYNTLAAYYFPRLEDTGLYPTITPVNVYRLLFNKYFNANLPLLPDRQYVLTELNTKWVDVSDRVRPLV